MNTDYTKIHRALIMNASFGYTLIQLSTNDQGKITDYKYVEVNSIFEQMLNHNGEKLSTNFASHVTPREFTDFLAFCNEFLANNNKHEFEYFSEPQRKWYKIKIYTPMEGYLAMHCYDIQKEKELLAKEREHDLRFKLLINANPDVMCFKDGTGRWLIANEAMVKLFNMDYLDYFYKTDEELSKMTNSQYVPAFLTCTGSDKKTWESRKLSISEEIIIDPEGEEMIYEFIKAPTFEDDGTRKGLIVIGRDITNRKQIELELKDAIHEAKSANRVKSNFLANMSHEIRTPLNSIIGFTDLLNDLSTNEEQKTYIKNANTAGHSLLELLDNILDFSKIEADKMEINPGSTNLRKLISEVFNVVNYAALSKGLDLILSIDESMPEIVYLDGRLLKQVLTNLLGNAVKFTDTGKATLNLKFEPIDQKSLGKFHFSVVDTGIGIDEKAKKQLFQIFTQADSSTKKKYGGTGLGLAISQRIVQKMGGNIQIESELHKGSIFSFSITATYENNTKKIYPIHEAVFEQKLLTYDFHPTIMIVEDNNMNMLISSKLVKTLLPQSTIIKARNGEEAVALSEKEEIDLILMDVRMPIMDGLEATKRIRSFSKSRFSQTVPIVALTAGATKEEIESCLSSGMNDYLIKPFKREDLLCKIQKNLVKRICEKENTQILRN